MGMRGALIGTDSWSVKPALVSWIAVAILALLCQLPGTVSFLLIPLTLLGFAAALLNVLIVAGYCFAKQRPRRGTSVLLVLFLPALL